MSGPSEYDAVVAAEKMPPCPICGKPINVPPVRDVDRLMVFTAHGMAALAHDGCRVAAFTEETCPGHVASAGDPKVCGRCGVHIDSFRPDDEARGP